MADKTVSEVLSEARGGGEWVRAGDIVGQVITIVDYEVAEGIHGPYLLIKCLDAEGEEFTLSNGGQIASEVQALNAAGFLPLEMKVTSFKSKYGTDGYSLAEV